MYSVWLNYYPVNKRLYLAILVTLCYHLVTAQTNQSNAPRITLGEAMAQYGYVTVPFAGHDNGKSNTGLRLVSHGKLYEDNAAQYTVWRIRNASDQSKEVTLQGYQAVYRTTLTVPAHTETYVRSSEANASATHLLLFQDKQIDVKASSPDAFADDTLTGITLAEAVARYGWATVGFRGNDAGKQNTGLRLVSHGKIYDDHNTALYTVWRVRNATDKSQKIVLKTPGPGFRTAFPAPAHSETFVRSDVSEGAATHLLLHRGKQVDVKASGQQPYEDARMIVHPVPEDARCAAPLRLDSVTLWMGEAHIKYLGADNGRQKTMLRLLSAGKVYDSLGTPLYSVWRIRNASDQDQSVTLRSKKGDFDKTLTARAHSETFVYGDALNQAATHLLFLDTLQLQAASGLSVPYNDRRRICYTLPDTLYAIQDGAWQDGNNWAYVKNGYPAGTHPQEGSTALINGYEITMKQDNACETLKVQVDTEDQFTKLILNRGTLTVKRQASVEKTDCTRCDSNIIVNNGKLITLKIKP